MNDWSNDVLATEETILHGVADDVVREISLEDGAILRSFHYTLASIFAIDGDTCIFARSQYLDGVNWSGRLSWSVEIAPGGLHAHAAGRLYAATLTPFRRALLCIEASTGKVAWQRELPAKGEGDAAMMSSTVGLVAVVGDRVLVIPDDGRRLIVLAAESGEIQTIDQLPELPSRGNLLVTENEVILFHPYALSFFDHREMTETRRFDLRDEVRPLYDGRPALAHGFCLTQDSAIWTTPHGAFMGISLEPGPDGRRVTWVEELPGALMSVGVSPVVHNGHMYYTNMGDPLELICYSSTARTV